MKSTSVVIKPDYEKHNTIYNKEEKMKFFDSINKKIASININIVNTDNETVEEFDINSPIKKLDT